MAAKGQPKTGGRKRGTPNKVTANIRQLASLHGDDMIAELARLALQSESEQVRVAAIREMLDRGYGKSVIYQDILLEDCRQTWTADMENKEACRLAAYFMVKDADRLQTNNTTHHLEVSND